MDNWSKPFFRSLLSESDGNVSSARFCIVLVVVFSLGWVTALVLQDKKLPDLGAVGAYVTLVCGSLYAINRGATILDHKQTSAQSGN
jgi:hypothetical protein